MNLGVMIIKGYSTLSRSPKLESHHQMQFSLILRNTPYPLQEIQSAYSELLQLRNIME